MNKHKKNLGVGFIGSGFIGQFHMMSWIGVRNADILGIVDKSAKTAEEGAAMVRALKIGNPKIFKSITEMVADPDIDAIWICAPNFTRLEIMQEIHDAVISGKGELIGVTCEKPLGRNLKEAKAMLELAVKANLLDGYLENQVFMPSVIRGRNIIWERGAKATGRPYLSRAAEEHCGPHMPWFWEGSLQGGGVLNDMMCHSVETARLLLTPPNETREILTPKKITAYTNCLKWQRPEYAKQLKDISNNKLDYINRPSEDFARSLIEYIDEKNNPLVVETSTSWCFVGAGLRLSMELLGPEYSMAINTLDTELKIFLSRNIQGQTGEDLLEKQNAESGLMPVVSNEAVTYGYESENRHMVQSFLEGVRPSSNFNDGVEVTRMLMAAYMSAEQDKTIFFDQVNLDDFIPEVAHGKWNPSLKK